MAHKPLRVLTAQTTTISFPANDRRPVLHFETADGKLVTIRLEEADMARVTGDFIRQRIFGLH